MRARAEVAAVARAMTDRNNNQPPMSGVYPDYAARRVQDASGARGMRDMRWGCRHRRMLLDATKARRQAAGERVLFTLDELLRMEPRQSVTNIPTPRRHWQPGWARASMPCARHVVQRARPIRRHVQAGLVCVHADAPRLLRGVWTPGRRKSNRWEDCEVFGSSPPRQRRGRAATRQGDPVFNVRVGSLRRAPCQKCGIAEPARWRAADRSMAPKKTRSRRLAWSSSTSEARSWTIRLLGACVCWQHVLRPGRRLEPQANEGLYPAGFGGRHTPAVADSDCHERRMNTPPTFRFAASLRPQGTPVPEEHIWPSRWWRPAPADFITRDVCKTCNDAADSGSTLAFKSFLAPPALRGAELFLIGPAWSSR